MTEHDSSLPAAAWVAALSALPELGPSRLRGLLSISEGDPRQAWHRIVSGAPIVLERTGPKVIDTWRTVARRFDVANRWAAMASLGIRTFVAGDPEWPPVLLDDPEPPAILFACGHRLRADAPAVAIVGTRRGSAYGRRIAWQLGASLAELGVTVVSGLALGVDAAAHEGALSVAGAPPVAVVGSGVDVVYPARNASLWSRLAENGTILSEASPGTDPSPWRFPARNRIIAGLSSAVVVVESHARGGSLITVDEALERGVPVGAVPGAITESSASGSNRLLADGAVPILGIDDVIEMIGGLPNPASAASENPGDATVREKADPALEAVVDAIGWSPVLLEQVCLRVDLEPSEVAVAIETLVLSGRCVRTGGWIERIAS